MTAIGIVVAFWVLAAITVGAALLVFLSRNLMHSVLFLVLVFIGMAGLFVTLSADFIAVAQVLIYAGAISVLLVFAIMLTPLASRDTGNSLFVLPGVLIGLGFAFVSALVAVRVGWPELTGSALDAQSYIGTVKTIGSALLGGNLLAFELASVLLLVALIGAIALVHEDDAR